MNTEGNTTKRRGRLILLGGLTLLIAAMACNLAGAGADEPTPTAASLSSSGERAAGESESEESSAAVSGEETANDAETDGGGDQAGDADGGPVTGKVRATDTLRVRTGGSTNCPILGQYEEGNEIVVLAKSTDGGWWQVPWGDNVGWMATAYTTPTTDVTNIPVLDAPECAPTDDAASTGDDDSATPEPTDEPGDDAGDSGDDSGDTGDTGGDDSGDTDGGGGDDGGDGDGDVTFEPPVNFCDLYPAFCEEGIPQVTLTIDPCILNPDLPSCDDADPDVTLDPAIIATLDYCVINPDACDVVNPQFEINPDILENIDPDLLND
jgi:uncharacterized protein YraI